MCGYGIPRGFGVMQKVISMRKWPTSDSTEEKKVVTDSMMSERKMW